MFYYIVFNTEHRGRAPMVTDIFCTGSAPPADGALFLAKGRALCLLLLPVEGRIVFFFTLVVGSSCKVFLP